MYSSLGAVEFLARSSSRVRILEAVADAPRARHELRDLTGASRVTVNRIVEDLEDREWIVREDGRCEATPRGRFVATEFTRLIDDLETLDRLGENVNWIRLDQFDFDLRRLADATVITPTWDDFAAYSNTLIDHIYESTTLRAIGTGLHREYLQAVADATLEGNLSLELIYVPRVFDAIESEPDLCRRLRDMADAEGVGIYRYQGADSLMMLGLHETAAERDDVALLCGQHEEGAPPGTVESTDARVWSWAESYFESVRDESRPVEPATLVADHAETT